MKNMKTHVVKPDELERAIQLSEWFTKRSVPGERLIVALNQDVPEFVRSTKGPLDMPPRQVRIGKGVDTGKPQWLRDMSIDDFILTFSPHILRITGGRTIVSHRLLWDWPHEDWAAEFVIQVDE